MLARERQTKIVNMLKAKGSVSSTKISKDLGVSLETVRRDLLELERRGQLSRVHGGAVSTGDMFTFHTLKDRIEERKEAKICLCRVASNYVNDGDVILVDSGSTAIYFANFIKDKNITVVTYSLDVFDILKYSPNVKVILCGGHYLAEENCVHGAFTFDMLDKLHVAKAFVFVSAISLKYGVCDFEKDVFALQKKSIEIADEVYILADSEKFEKHGLLKLCDVNDEYVFITDTGLSDTYKNAYIERGLKLILGE